MKTREEIPRRLIVGQMPCNLHFILMAFLDNLFFRLFIYSVSRRMKKNIHIMWIQIYFSRVKVNMNVEN